MAAVCIHSPEKREWVNFADPPWRGVNPPSLEYICEELEKYSERNEKPPRHMYGWAQMTGSLLAVKKVTSRRYRDFETLLGDGLAPIEYLIKPGCFEEWNRMMSLGVEYKHIFPDCSESYCGSIHMLSACEQMLPKFVRVLSDLAIARSSRAWSHDIMIDILGPQFRNLRGAIAANPPPRGMIRGSKIGTVRYLCEIGSIPSELLTSSCFGVASLKDIFERADPEIREILLSLVPEEYQDAFTCI